MLANLCVTEKVLKYSTYKAHVVSPCINQWRVSISVSENKVKKLPSQISIIYSKGNLYLYSTKSLCESFVVRKKLQKFMFVAKSRWSDLQSARIAEDNRHSVWSSLCCVFSPLSNTDNCKTLERSLIPGAKRSSSHHFHDYTGLCTCTQTQMEKWSIILKTITWN